MSHETPPAYTLRDATEADYDFLYDLARTTMRGYVEEIWGWDEDFQEERFRANFSPQEWRIVVIDEMNVGGLNAQYKPSEVYLSNIYILPEYQNRGIGTDLIEELKQHANRLNIPVKLSVLITNRSAQRLYHRLGFTVIEESTDKLLMSTPSRSAR